MMKNPSVSAFFPCYGDEGTIASMVIKMDSVLRGVTNDYEIIVVNDASPDGSAKILAELAKKIPRLKVVTHEKNRGYGGALMSGFANATKELIFYTDGDAQYDVGEFPKLLALMDERTDIVQGFKIKRSDPFHRVILGRMYHHVAKFLFCLRVRDVDCDFRLIRARAIRKVRLTRTSGLICLEMMKKLQDSGARIREVGVHHYHRVHGRSQFFNFARVIRVLIGIFVLWWEITILRRR